MRVGEIRQLGGKPYALCSKCGSLVRLNKPLLGSLHVCVEDEESAKSREEVAHMAAYLDSLRDP